MHKQQEQPEQQHEVDGRRGKTHPARHHAIRLIFQIALLISDGYKAWWKLLKPERGGRRWLGVEAGSGVGVDSALKSGRTSTCTPSCSWEDECRPECRPKSTSTRVGVTGGVEVEYKSE